MKLSHSAHAVVIAVVIAVDSDCTKPQQRAYFTFTQTGTAKLLVDGSRVPALQRFSSNCLF